MATFTSSGKIRKQFVEPKGMYGSFGPADESHVPTRFRIFGSMYKGKFYITIFGAK